MRTKFGLLLNLSVISHTGVHMLPQQLVVFPRESSRIDVFPILRVLDCLWIYRLRQR